MNPSKTMVPPGPSSPSFPSVSSNTDPIQSFGEFLDLITPAEFSKLLKARVRHLLTTWPPPENVITSNLSTCTPSSPLEHSCSPSLESIRAFAVFFHSRDSSPSSPIDDTVATSLSSLHRHLMALQTLFSILSGRELKEIVRARLADGGKERALALRGLMDVMRTRTEDEEGSLSHTTRGNSPRSFHRSECGKAPEFTDEGLPSPKSEENGAPPSGTIEPTHSSTSQLSECHVSRSRSRSLPRSVSGDRASPPGPMLRTAVDWASGVSTVADEGLEEPLAFRPSAIFNPENDDGTIEAGMFVMDDGWDDDVVQNSKADTSIERRAAERRKLFIRLPPRPKHRLSGPGMAFEGSITPSSSSSARHSPAFDLDMKKSPKINATDDILPTDEYSGKGILQAFESLPDSSNATSTTSHNITPTAPNIAAPRAQCPVQYSPGSRPQSGSPGVLAHGTYTIPQHAYPQPQPHPYPGPWFGAMFYVPLHGPPHALPKVPSGPSRQASDVTARMGTEDKASASSAPANTATSSAHPPSFEGKRAVKRHDPHPPKPASPPLDPDMTYTDDVGVKESATVKRRCFNCRGIHAPSWRKSKLTFGKILCNKCGIYESTHMTARPLKTRPRRSQSGAEGEANPPKKRKCIKKLPPAL